MQAYLYDVMYYYWPKMLSGLWFALINVYLLRESGRLKKFSLFRVVLYFFISSATLSIVAELFAFDIQKNVLKMIPSMEGNYPLLIVWNIFIDGLFIFFGGLVFTYTSRLNAFVGATIYMEYVCVDRFCMVVAVSPLTLLAVYIIALVIVYLVQKQDIPMMFADNTVNWKRIFIYLLGLFFILDILYGGYFIFPELGTNVFNLENLLWLDIIALICSAFVLGYLKISVSEAKQISRKLNYMHKLQHSQEDIIISLAQISEAKSGETGQHIRRVAEYSKVLAERLLPNEYDIETIRVAAMMHDLGKLMISQDILAKEGKLTEEEYEEIKTHSKFGWDLLSNSKGDVMEMARVIALQHHERWDGMGYPAGLRGKQISIYAQIVSVTDVYDALTSERSYKEAWPPEVARKEIIDQRGKQFSPLVVDAFVSCYEKIEEIRHRYADE